MLGDETSQSPRDEVSQINRINLDLDREEFEKFATELKKLGDRANVDVHIIQPSRDELERCLQETWHIIAMDSSIRTQHPSEPAPSLALKN